MKHAPQFIKNSIALMFGAFALSSTILAKESKARPVVEVAFVIDSTGSMSGLIEGAKEKIWSIANHIILRESNPQVRIGLLAYRDRGDEYVTRIHALSDDMDTVYADLSKIVAGGGGDSPESVNQALHEALTSMQWSSSENTKRMIFLVGDCPPHMDYKDDVKYQRSCKRAAKAGIIIHTVQCGNHSQTTPIWKEIATLGNGSYVPLPQNGGMVAITAPQDQEIAQLSSELAKTSLAWGDQTQKQSVLQKNATAACGTAQNATERACYNLHTGGRAIQGKGDLLTDLAEGKAKIETIKPEELPAELKSLNSQEREEFVKKQQSRRDELNGKISALLTERNAHIAAEKQKLAKESKADAFDSKVAEAIDEKLR